MIEHIRIQNIILSDYLLLYLCVLATGGLILKIIQLRKERKI